MIPIWFLAATCQICAIPFGIQRPAHKDCFSTKIQTPWNSEMSCWILPGFLNFFHPLTSIFSWRTIRWWCSLGIFHPDFPGFHQWRPASGNQRKWFNSLGCLGKFGHMVFVVVLFFPKQSENWLKSVTTQSVVGNLLFCILFGVPISSYTWRLWFCCHLCGTNRKLWRCVRSMWRLVVSGYVISRKQSCWRIAMWRMRRLRLVSIFSSHLFRIGKIKTWEDDQSCTESACCTYISNLNHARDTLNRSDIWSWCLPESTIQESKAQMPIFQTDSFKGARTFDCPVLCFLLYCEVGWVKTKNLNKMAFAFLKVKNGCNVVDPIVNSSNCYCYYWVYPYFG